MLVSISMLSESAAYDDAMSRFVWKTYHGKPIELTQRKHKRQIKEGDLYGTRLVRGGNYYLIFADAYHVDYPIDASVFERIDSKAQEAKTPQLEQYAGARAPKSAGLKMLARKLRETDFDAPRFTLKGVKRESANGVDLSNYQWRIVEPMQLRVRHSKGYETFIRGDIIGMRFLKESRGGYVVNRDGLWVLVKSDEYDSIVDSTKMLALQDWPTGMLTADALSEYKTNKADTVKRTASEKREAQLMEERANRYAEKLAAREAREAKRLADRKRKAELGQLVRDASERIKVSEMRPMSDTEYREMKAGTQPTFASTVDASIIESDFDDNEFDFEEKDVQPDNEHVIADNAGLMDTLDIALGLDDDSSEVGDEGADHDLSNVPDVEDVDSIDDDLSKGRKKVKDPKAPDAKVSKDSSEDEAVESDAAEDEDLESEDDTALEDEDLGDEDEDTGSDGFDDDEDLDDGDDGFDDDSDDEDLEDDSDDEDDTALEDDESDEDDEDLEGDDSDDADDTALEDDESDEDLEDDDSEDESDDEDLEDVDSEDEEDLEGEDGFDDDSDEDESDEDLEGDIGDEDLDSSEDADENIGSDEEDPVDSNPEAVDDSDAGDAKTRKSAKEAEEGDIITFHDDVKRARSWVILDVEPHKANDRILVYTLYDMAGKKEEIRQVRVNTAKGQHILDMCDLVGQVKPKEFSSLQAKAENYDLNKEAISS